MLLLPFGPAPAAVPNTANGIIQVYKNGGITNVVGTPNLLADITNMVSAYTWTDQQQGGLDNGVFELRKPYEYTGAFQSPNWIIAAHGGGPLAANVSAGASSITVNNLTNIDGVLNIQTGDYFLITDGMNTEMFKATVSGANPWTIALSAAPGPNTTTLANAYTASKTRVARLVYQGYMVKRARTSNLDNAYSITTKGFFNRYNDVLTNADIVLQDAGNSIYGLVNSYSGTLSEIIVTSANIAQATGKNVTTKGQETKLVQFLTDVLRQENAQASPSVYTLRVGPTREVFHALLPTTTTQTIDLLTGSSNKDQLGPLNTEDQDITGLVNAVIVQGGKKPNGQQLRIIVYDSNSVTQYGYFEGVLTNTDLTDEATAANWAAQQLSILAYPRTNSKASYTFSTLRLSAQDYLKITGFTDGTTLSVYPLSVTYRVDAATGIATSTVDLAQLKPDLGQIFREILGEHVPRAINQTRQPSPVGDAYVVRGFDLTTSGTTVTITDGVIRWLGIDYYVPSFTGTASQLVTYYGANIGASPPATQVLPSVASLGPQYGLNSYKITSQGGQPAAQTTFSGVPLWRVTLLSGAIVGTQDLRPLGAPIQGTGKNLIPDSDMKLGKHFWPKQYMVTIANGVADGGINGAQYLCPANQNTFTEYAPALNQPVQAGIIQGPEGDIWFCTHNAGANGTIVRMTKTGTVVSQTLLAAGAAPNDIKLGLDGFFYVTDTFGHLYKLNPVTLAVTTVTIASTGLFGGTVGYDANVWVVDYTAGNQGMWRVQQSGTVTNFKVTGTIGPNFCAATTDGRLWTSETHRVAVLDPSTGSTGPAAYSYISCPTGTANPLGVVIGPDGNVWYPYNNLATIAKVVPGTSAITEYTSANAGKWASVGPDGLIWYTNEGTGLFNFDVYSQATQSFTVPTGTAVCHGVAFDSVSGDVYITESTSNKIARRITGPYKQNMVGAPFALQPNTTYTLSCWIDATNVTSGSPAVVLKSQDLLTTYATLTQIAGRKSRVSVTFTTGGGVTSGVCQLHVNGCAMTSNTLLTWSKPQLEIGTQMSAYESNIIDDQTLAISRSTSFNANGQLPIITGAPAVSWSTTAGAGPQTASITFTTPATITTFMDGTTKQLTAMNTTINNLFNGAAPAGNYYFNVKYNLTTNAFVVTTYYQLAPSQLQRILDLYSDGFVALLDSQNVQMPNGGAGGSSGSGGGGGGTKGTCPLRHQMMRAIDMHDGGGELEIRADELIPGRHMLLNPEGGHNAIFSTEIRDCVGYEIETDFDTVSVNDTHGCKDESGAWVAVTDLRPGMRLMPPLGMPVSTVRDVRCVGRSQYVAIKCANQNYILGSHIGHNTTF